MSLGSVPRSPSLPPSSTSAASGLSVSAQSSRERPPAVVSPDTPPSRICTSNPSAFSAPPQLGLEAVGLRQAVAGGQRVAEHQQLDRAGQGGAGEGGAGLRRHERENQQQRHGGPRPGGPGTIWGDHGHHPAFPNHGTARPGARPPADRARSRRAGQHPGRHRPGGGRGRGGRHRGAFRLRQDQPADGARGAGARDRGQRHRGRARPDGAGRGRAGAVPARTPWGSCSRRST